MFYVVVLFLFLFIYTWVFTFYEIKKEKNKETIRKQTYEPVREKTNNLGFRPGPTQTGLYSHRKWLEAGNFGFRKKRDCTIHVAKTKALISFAVTAKLICGFVFAYANCCFSHAQAHIIVTTNNGILGVLRYTTENTLLYS